MNEWLKGRSHWFCKENRWYYCLLALWMWVLVCAIFLLLIFAMFGCHPFGASPATLPEVKTITNTVIRQVKVNDWLVTGSILVMGISVFGFLNGWKQGLNAVIAAAAVLGVSLILRAYGGVLIFTGAVCIAGLIGWQIFVRIKALHEIVKNVERIKKISGVVLSKDGKDGKTYIQPSMVKAVLSMQSPSTKTLVAGIRKKLNGGAE